MIIGKIRKVYYKFSFYLIKFHSSARYVRGSILELVGEIRTGKAKRKS